MGLKIPNAYVNICQALEDMERCAGLSIWNLMWNVGFACLEIFTSKMSYYQKTGHLLALK